jgi:hypothetical protein
LLYASVTEIAVERVLVATNPFQNQQNKKRS